MNRRQINENCKNLFDSWTDSISESDTLLQQQVREHAYIAGGAIASLIQGEHPHDYDIYFDDFDIMLKVAEWYVNKFNALYNDDRLPLCVSVYNDGDSAPTLYYSGRRDVPENADLYVGSHQPVHITNNAISLNSGIQIITKFVGRPQDVVENFDYLHAQAYWKPDTGCAWSPDCFEAIHNKALIYTTSAYPLSAMMRIRKFLKRGYSIHAAEMLKIAIDLQRFDLYDPEVLQDQIAGIDYNYFKGFLERLQEEAETSIDDVTLEWVLKTLDEQDA
jgi:hypothetical protein